MSQCFLQSVLFNTERNHRYECQLVCSSGKHYWEYQFHSSLSQKNNNKKKISNKKQVSPVEKKVSGCHCCMQGSDKHLVCAVSEDSFIQIKHSAFYHSVMEKTCHSLNIIIWSVAGR